MRFEDNPLLTSVATSADDVVLIHREGAHVAVVTLNRPAQRNAVSVALAQAMERHVKAVEADDSVRVVILTGSGSLAFCAGADLKELAGGGDTSGRSTKDGGFGGFVLAQRRKLWIAAVNGPAVAGGCEFALTCDLIVAADHAVFGVPEVKRGLVATAGGTYRLPRSIPRAVALEMIATGEPITAQRAYALGLVNRVVPLASLMTEALGIAETVCANAPIAVQESLNIARQVCDLDEAALRVLAQQAIDRIVKTEDFIEGPRAFSEHRTPKWTGR